MSIEELFDHKCDIYHLVTEENNPGYNLPSSPFHEHPSEAAEKAVKCHFNIKAGNSTSMVQTEPQNVFSERTKLNLKAGTDIRLHDKVVNCETGLEYTVVAPPRNIRGHHIAAFIERIGGQKPL